MSVSAWSVAPNDVVVVVVVVDLLRMKAFEWFDIWCDVFFAKTEAFLKQVVFRRSAT